MRRGDFRVEDHAEAIGAILDEVERRDVWQENSLYKILTGSPKSPGKLFSRDNLVEGYRYLVKLGRIPSTAIEERIRMKPMRTHSGVATITVLTKPYPCPGTCIFCPNDVRMPKSYLADEPGAQRAEMNSFDPYLQTYNRLEALKKIGHTVEKAELIVLGGTWSFYPREYQIWFIEKCFEAMNDFGVRDQRETIRSRINNIFKDNAVEFYDHTGRLKPYNQLIGSIVVNHNQGFFRKDEFSELESLYAQHTLNEDAQIRCVGLVIETRPDYLDEEEVTFLRKLGATKIQIGIQSLDDTVMQLNKRGHGSEETRNAIQLLRRAGFKIHAHWMPNLYGSTVDNDIEDYRRLWDEPYRPDELKIYPTSIIANTELHSLYTSGKYSPYSFEELLRLFERTLPITPRYNRLTRIIRDIPSTDIVAGNKLTNFRQIAESKIAELGFTCECIRCREIKTKSITLSEIELETIAYQTSSGTEYFLSYRTKRDDKICGYLRLHLPDKKSFIEELGDNAIIREVHVYGQVVSLGQKLRGKTQHLGLGTKLIDEAKRIAAELGYRKLSVISAIGTRKYYEKRGFERGMLYMSTKTK